jgi:hypothetical protein
MAVQIEFREKPVRRPSIWSKAWRAFRSDLGAARELVAENWAGYSSAWGHERFHRKRDPLRLCVGAEHFDLHNLSGLDRFGGILNEAVREFADVY